MSTKKLKSFIVFLSLALTIILGIILYFIYYNNTRFTSNSKAFAPSSTFNPICGNNSFASFSQVVYFDNSYNLFLKQTLLSRDGKTNYWRIVPWKKNLNNGKGDWDWTTTASLWSTRWGDLTTLTDNSGNILGPTFSSFTETIEYTKNPNEKDATSQILIQNAFPAKGNGEYYYTRKAHWVGTTGWDFTSQDATWKKVTIKELDATEIPFTQATSRSQIYYFDNSNVLKTKITYLNLAGTTNAYKVMDKTGVFWHDSAYLTSNINGNNTYSSFVESLVPSGSYNSNGSVIWKLQQSAIDTNGQVHWYRYATWDKTKNDWWNFTSWINQYGDLRSILCTSPAPTITNTPTPTPIPICLDSDGGKDYYVGGYVTKGNSAQNVDSCSITNGVATLIENYCSNNNPATKQFVCVAGCKNTGKGQACIVVSNTPIPTATPIITGAADPCACINNLCSNTCTDAKGASLSGYACSTVDNCSSSYARTIGDTDGDGKVCLTDYTHLINAMDGLYGTTSIKFYRAEFNKDKDVGNLDRTILINNLQSCGTTF